MDWHNNDSDMTVTRLVPLFGLLMALGLTSCVKDVIMDAKEKPAVAIACILSDNPVQELDIVYTKGASLEEAPKVLEAEAVLKDLTTGETISFERQDDGIWRMDYAAVPEHKYRLEVRVPGYGSFWAEDNMPKSIHVYLQHKYWLRDLVESPTGYFYAESWIPEDHSLYPTQYWLDGENLPTGETYFGIAELDNPVWIYAMNYNPVTGQREIADEICTDYRGADDFNLTCAAYVPPRWIEPVPYPLKTQFADLFSGTQTKALYPILKNMPIHQKFLRIPAKGLKNDRGGIVPIAFGVSGSFYGKYNSPDNFMDFFYNYRWGTVRDLADDEGYIVWTAVSEVLDKYLKEAIQIQQIDASSDLSTIYLRDNFYVNIKDSVGDYALGLFGCKIERKYQWSPEGDYLDISKSSQYNSYQELIEKEGISIPADERGWYKYSGQQ